MICLDTTYLWDWIADPSRIVTITKELEGKEVLATTSHNVFEAFLGAFAVENKTLSARMIDKLERFLVPVHVLPFDSEDAAKAGEILAKLKKKGKAVGIDAITAAIALNSGCSGIVSRNRAHFKDIEKVTGLKLVEY
ncbi:MAG: type II toxin-antitoxin system VapC family toxin [Thermoplasmata archaeon]|nr:type II toxin-antitoxin system VapC family toxin [Thermoplasmata archaeon]